MNSSLEPRGALLQKRHDASRASGRLRLRKQHENRHGERPSDGRLRASARAFDGSAPPRSARPPQFQLQAFAPLRAAPPLGGCCARARLLRFSRIEQSARIEPLSRLGDAHDPREEHVDAPSGAIPRRVNTNPNRALSEARRMSAANNIVAPIPTAGPLTAAMTGFVQSNNRSVIRPQPSRGAGALASLSAPMASRSSHRRNRRSALRRTGQHRR